MNQEANIKAWSGNMSSSRTNKLKKYTFCQQSDVDAVFGTLMGPSSSITKIMDSQSIVHGIVLCLKRMQNCYLQ
jgi:hypothetical protein